jgi:hypothetical protein
MDQLLDAGAGLRGRSLGRRVAHAAAVPLSLSARRDKERASRSSAVTAFAEGGSGSSASSSPTLPIVLGHTSCAVRGSANDDEAVEGWHAGRAVLDRLEVAEVAVELVSAFSRTAQVLNTTTSGCAPSATGA